MAEPLFFLMFMVPCWLIGFLFLSTIDFLGERYGDSNGFERTFGISVKRKKIETFQPTHIIAESRTTIREAA